MYCGKVSDAVFRPDPFFRFIVEHLYFKVLDFYFWSRCSLFLPHERWGKTGKLILCKKCVRGEKQMCPLLSWEGLYVSRNKG